MPPALMSNVGELLSVWDKLCSLTSSMMLPGARARDCVVSPTTSTFAHAPSIAWNDASACPVWIADRFSWGLGMTPVAKSDQSTGNSAFASYAVQSGELVFAITAPYSRACRAANVNVSLRAVTMHVQCHDTV